MENQGGQRGVNAQQQGGHGQQQGGFVQNHGGFSKQQGGHGQQKGGFVQHQGGFSQQQQGYGQYEHNPPQFRQQMVSQIQKPISTQKEKQFMVNHILGKELALIELVFQRCGGKIQPDYSEYLAEVSLEASLTDLLRSIKSFHLSLSCLSMDSDEALKKALGSKVAVNSIKKYTKMAKSLEIETEGEVVAQQVLLAVLDDLKEGTLKPLSAEISNKIYPQDARNRGAERLTTHNQDQMVQNVYNAQQGISALTSQIHGKSSSDPEFTTKPDINISADDFDIKKNAQEGGFYFW